jgi:PAS domain S-box-containing protein
MNVQSHPIRVLLIDDDEEDFIVVRDLLADIYSVEFVLKWVSDYGPALDAILSGEFDVCLLDYRLKDRNGLDFMQEAVSRGAMTPIVFLTGQGGYDLDVEAMSKGAADWLTKHELSATLLERSIRHAMERQRKKEELIKAKRIIQALSECNDVVIHFKDEASLLRAICRIVVEVGGYRMAWVGYAKDDRDRTVTPVAKYGYETDYLETANVTWKDEERGKGPTGTCIRTGLHSIIRSVDTRADRAPWRLEASKRGYASIIGLPLFVDGQRLGALTIYSSETDAFDTEEVEFLYKISVNLSHGIGVLRLRKARVQAEELLKEANLGLEKRVEERTEELVKVNAELRKEVEERRQAEEALRESREFLDKIVNSTSDPIYVVDSRHRYVLANDALCAVAGWKREDILGRTDYDFFPEEQVDNFRKEDEAVLETGEESENEEEITHADGTTLTVVTKKTLYTDRCGNKFIVGLIRDITRRKKAELALQASHRQLQDIVEFLPDATFVIDRDKKVIAWNRAIEEMTGVEKCDILGKGDYAYAVPFYSEKRPILIDLVMTKNPEIEKRYDSVKRAGKTLCVETFAPAAYRGKGAYLWSTAAPLIGEGGRIIGSIQVIRDITERKLAEQALAEEVIRRRILFEQSSDGIVILDLNGKVYEANQRYAEMLGYSAEEISQLHVWDWDAELTQDYLQERLRNADAEGAVFERRHRRKDGTICDVEITSNSIELAGQKLVFCVCRDISQRRVAEKALRASEAKFRSYIESAPLGIFVADRQGRLIDFNPAAGNLLGYDAAALRNMHILDLHPEEDREEVRGDFATLLEVGCVVTERRMKKSDGQLIWVSLHVVMTEDQLSLGYCQDITERKQMDEALRESEARLRQIIDLVPHRIFVKDWDGKYLLANKAVAEVYNTSVNNLTGKCHADFHPDASELQRMSQDDREVMTKGETKFIPEEPFTDARGNRCFAQAIKVPFHIFGDKTPAVLGVAIDITDKKRAEEVLRESEAKYRLISENTGDVIWQFDLDNNQFVYISPSVYRLVGFTPEELVGKNMEAVLTPASMKYVSERLPEIIKALNAGDESVRVLTQELEQLRKDGSVVPIEVVVTLLQDTSGRVDRIIGVSRDITAQHHAAESLRESEAKFRTLFEAMTEGVALHEIVYDERGVAVDYRIISTNPAFEKHTGLKSERVLGELAGKAYGLDKAPYLARYAMVASSGESDSFETHFAPLNRFFHISVTSPKRGYFVTVFENITERKQAEEALKESQQQLANIIDFLPDATLVIDNEGQVIAWNKAIEEMTGVKATDMLGKGNYEYALPFYGERRPILIDLIFGPREEILPEYTSIERRATEITGEAYMPALRTGETYLYGTASVLRDSTGNIVGAVESIRDITERKRAEDALRESEERFHRFFRASPFAVSILRPIDNRFADINDAFPNLFGYTREEIIGQNALELGVWADPADWARMFGILQKEGRVQDFETRFRKKSGEIMDVRFSAEVIEVAGQEYLLCLTEDITERKRGEEERRKLAEQLFQAQKMESVGRLAGGVAHDFNNMLGVIIGRSEMALEKGVPPDKLRDNLKEILKAGLRSADLTRQLLAFARKQTAVPRTLDLNETISGMLNMLRRLIDEDITLFWVPGLDLWKVKIDPSQVDQILANLVVNARDAISGVGDITMRTENVVIDDSNRAANPEFIPGEYVLLTMSDTGVGMSREIREKVFEPFFTTKELGKGTGLGLSTVYGIVKQNDGVIHVSSEPGQGTTFTIYLPRFEVQTERVPSEDAADKHPTGTETILLVEDDEAILNLSRIILERLGYTVLAAKTPGQAISLAKQHPGELHLLITDVVMPEMNGRELAEKLGPVRPNLKCLFMSGYTADVIAHRGILDEGVNFIQKPFGSNDLAVRVRRVLDNL